MVAPADIVTARAGHASLEVRHVHGESAVTSSYATTPLKLLTPRARGQSVWACTSSFGGGFVTGDQTSLELSVGQNTRCYLGTQASSKVYRNTALRPCGHTTHAKVDAGALLVFAPDPVQPFAGSNYTQRQEFHLATDASLVLVDWFSAGRAARGERWAFNRFQSRNEIHLRSSRREEAPFEETESEPPHVGCYNQTGCELIFLDSLLLDPQDGTLSSQHRTGRFNCFATLLILGPAVASLAKTMLTEISQQPVQRQAPLLSSASPLRDGLILRMAGTEVEAVGRELRRHLAPLSAQLGDDPWARKW